MREDGMKLHLQFIFMVLPILYGQLPYPEIHIQVEIGQHLPVIALETYWGCGKYSIDVFIRNTESDLTTYRPLVQKLALLLNHSICMCSS